MNQISDSNDVLDLIYDALMQVNLTRKLTPDTQFTLRQQGSTIILSTGTPEWEITVKRTVA